MLGLVVLIVLFNMFKIQSGVITCSILLGVVITVFLEDVFRTMREDDVTRKQIEDTRKGNY
jgi:hypothetical protein